MNWNKNILPFHHLLILLLTAVSCNESSESLKDIDGNVYKTVKIGEQIWMAENLKVTRYRNGDPMPNIPDSIEWRSLTTGAYCNYNNDTTFVATYGRLYNWFAVNDPRSIAPEGWHIPTPEELKTLLDYLGGDYIAGGKLKEKGTDQWQYPNLGATNESGFSGLPGGYRFTMDSAKHPIGGTYHALGSNGFWWTTSDSYQLHSWDILTHIRFADIIRDYTNKTYGFSVRCVKDQN